MAVFALNDHVLKGRLPSLLTGKLSDVSGLVFFPLMLQAAAEWSGLAVVRNNRVLFGAIVATGLGFLWVETTVSGDMAFRWTLGALQWPVRSVAAVLSGGGVPSVAPVPHVADVEDLLALPALYVAWLVGRERAR